MRAFADALFARRLSGARSVSPNAPAVILFTSGSEGTPKGVVLSHRTLLSNAGQARARIDFNPNDVTLNALPCFHSFGLTVGFLLPLLNGIKCVLYPNPLHFRQVPEVAYDTEATILFGTDTFLAGYGRQAHPYDFRSVRYIFAGAEKIRDETRRLWSERFGVRILEGYGTTETGPVLAINTAMHSKTGSVGRLMTGIDYRLEPVEGLDRGQRLFVKGPNVMLGYLKADRPGVLQPPADGWYDTGDIVEIDTAGFVHILGRAKRFAKVAGEMVSLSAVEDWASALWPDCHHAVIAIPDSRKGERVVLVTTKSGAVRGDLAAFIRAQHLPEIATPAELRIVGSLPLLGTGKTNYPAVKALVQAPSV
jgi:acyl-[acyl-carrier-protein]-phospholipid O-acyltransferase/long-chain-fatty-acid--[acyl-carrier-protein] ligase